MKRRLLGILLCGVALFIGTVLEGTPRVEAHAVLDRSIPSAGRELTVAPTVVEMWFTEPIEAEFSEARLLNTAGNDILTDPAITDPNDPYRLTLPLPNLSPGVYTVAWQNLSTADGHQWQGAFAFTVLHPDGTRPDGTPAVLDDIPIDGTLRPGLIIARWFQMVGATLLFGLLFFRLALEREVRVVSDTRFRGYAHVGLLASIVGILLYIVTQLNLLGGVQVLPNFLLDSMAGQLVLLRLGLLIGLTLLIFFPLERERLRLSLALSGAGLLWLSYSMGSHAAAAPGGVVWAVAVDAIHALSAATWVGGLWMLPSVLGDWRTNPSAKAQKARVGVIRRFSATAFILIVVMAVTGVFSALVHIPSLNALLDSRYGQTLLVKVGITLIALFVAWRNRDLLHHKVGEIYQTVGHRRFWWQLAIEGSIVLVLLGSVAMLVQTNLPPAETKEEGYVESIIPADDLQVHVQVSPNKVGFNRFLVHLYHEDSSPIGDVQLVRLIFTYQNEDRGNTTVEMTPVNSSIFELEGSYYSQPGDWLLSVYVRRRGMDDVLVDIPFQVASATPPNRLWGNPIPLLPALVVVGGVGLVIGVALYATGQTKPFARWKRSFTLAGMALVVIGVGMSVTGNWLNVTGNESNEPPNTLESVARGGELYTANCVGCHGVTGQGDGAVASSLTVPPANLIEHVPAHTNRGLYQFIQFGFPDSGMPPFGDTLPERDIWALVHYLRAEYGQGIAPP